jgi:uncharacterized protein with GYD domain
MSTYMALVDVNEPEIRNAQELATIWAEIREDLDQVGGSLEDAYAILGEHDFLVLFEADGRDEAIQASIGMERYGLDTQTMEIMNVENLGRLVEDF